MQGMIVNVACAVNPALIILWYNDKARRIGGACVDRVWLLLVVWVALGALMVLPTPALYLGIIAPRHVDGV